MHTIHLRDPWKCEPSGGGAVCWSRLFHRPTGLSGRETVWLVLAPVGDEAVVDAHVTFSGELLPACDFKEAVRFNVTPLLADGNRVEILLPHVTETRPFEVWLEIAE